MVTASHNPANTYNGYKACRGGRLPMTSEAADAVCHRDARRPPIFSRGHQGWRFDAALEQGGVFISGRHQGAVWQNIKAQSVRPSFVAKPQGWLVYSPLNGSNLVPVTRDAGDRRAGYHHCARATAVSGQ